MTKRLSTRPPQAPDALSVGAVETPPASPPPQPSDLPRRPHNPAGEPNAEPEHRGERFKVLATSKQFAGVRGGSHATFRYDRHSDKGLRFAAGVAYTDDEALVRWCLDCCPGYTVIDLTTGKPVAPFVVKHFEISAPQLRPFPTFERDGVTFIHGVAITSEEQKVETFRTAGYEVKPILAAPPPGPRQQQQAGRQNQLKSGQKGRFRLVTPGDGSFIHGDVEFVDGVAFTDDPLVAEHFRQSGVCKVEIVEPESKAV